MDYLDQHNKEGIINAALACGFQKSIVGDIYILICTPTQLIQYSAEVANTVIQQLKDKI